jgi:hypothetical protein
MVVPALGLMVADQDAQAIDQGAADRVVQDMTEIVDRLAGSDRAAPSRAHGAIAGVPAESATDVLLLKMLRAVLARQGVAMASIADTKRALALSATIEARPPLVCIAALPPGGNVNARFFCRRLRAELPDAYILVLLPEPQDKRGGEAAARLREAGANDVAYDLQEAARLLTSKIS